MKTRMPMVRQLTALLPGLCCLLPAVAHAVDSASAGFEECAQEGSVRFRGATVELENDLFTGTDQSYTNGVGLTLVSHDIPGRLHTECLPAAMRLHAQIIQLLNPRVLGRCRQSCHQNADG